jgi:hypothetical protein
MTTKNETKAVKLTPTQKALAAEEARLIVEQAKLAEMKAAVADKEAAARDTLVAASAALDAARKAVNEAVAQAQFDARVLVPKHGEFYSWHPDLVHAVEAKLGVTWANRSTLAVDGRRHHDPFNDALSEIQTRVLAEIKARPEIVALEKEQQRRFNVKDKAWRVLHEIEGTYQNQYYLVNRIERDVRDLQEKVRVSEARREDRKWAQKAKAKDEAAGEVDPAKARAKLRAIAAGDEKLEW